MQINPGAGYAFTSSGGGHNLTILEPWYPWPLIEEEPTHPFKIKNVSIETVGGTPTVRYQVESGTINNLVPVIDDFASGTSVKLDRTTAGVANPPTAQLTSTNYNATTKTSYITLRCGPSASTGAFPDTDVTTSRYPTVIGGSDPLVADNDTQGFLFIGTITVDSITAPTTFTVSQNVTGSLWGDRLKTGTDTARYYYARI